MLKIVHARLQHYLNQEIPDVQAGFRKGKGTRDQITNIFWITEKARGLQRKQGNFRKFSISVSLTMLKPLTMWIIISCGKLLEICDTRSSYLSPEKPACSQEATVRTLYGKTDWLKIEKGVQQGCLLSPCLLNLYAEHIMRNAGLDELQDEMTNLHSVLKSRYITLLKKVHIVKAMDFPVVTNVCENWIVKKAEYQRIDAFKLWCWRRFLRVSWAARRSNQ